MSKTHSRTHLGDLLNVPVVPAPEFADWCRRRGRQQPSHPDRSEDRDPSGHASSSTAAGASSSLTEAEYRFLEVVCRHPGEPSGACARRAGIAHRRAAQIRARLRELGFVREHTVNLKSRGRPAIIIAPLAPAVELFGSTPAERPGATSS